MTPRDPMSVLRHMSNRLVFDSTSEAILDYQKAIAQVEALVVAARSGQKACAANWFFSDGEDERNNDDCIDADELLQKALAQFTPPSGGCDGR